MKKVEITKEQLDYFKEKFNQIERNINHIAEGRDTVPFTGSCRMQLISIVTNKLQSVIKEIEEG